MIRKNRLQKVAIKGVTSTTKFDYKDVDLLRQFLTDSGKIIPRSRTGVTAKQQRMLSKAIKRARFLALLPFTR